MSWNLVRSTMEGSVLSFLKAEWKVSDTGSAQCWASSFQFLFITTKKRTIIFFFSLVVVYGLEVNFYFYNRKLLKSIHIQTFLSFLCMHSQSNNSQQVHVDYNQLKGRLVLISSLMFRKSRSLEDIICQYIDVELLPKFHCSLDS